MIALSSFVLLALTASARAYFLVGRQYFKIFPPPPFRRLLIQLLPTESILVIERADPIVSPGAVAGHVHRVIGGSNFGVEIPSSDYLRESECTSSGIQEDKSAYWFPQLYFEYADGSFELVPGGPVTYYLFPDQPGQTTIFPDNFRMISGNASQAPPLGSFAQEAVSFLCLDFNGVSTRSNFLPETPCPSGVRAQLVSLVCRTKSASSSHISLPRTFKAAGTERMSTPTTINPTSPTAAEGRTAATVLLTSRSTFPVSSTRCTTTLPVSITKPARLKTLINHSCTSRGSFVTGGLLTIFPRSFSNGDATGAMYHGDFYMGWDRATLQRVVDQCNCNPYGDFTCCVQQGIMTRQSTTCSITSQIDEEGTSILDN